jgi:hypothetical protein
MQLTGNNHLDTTGFSTNWMIRNSVVVMRANNFSSGTLTAEVDVDELTKRLILKRHNNSIFGI